MNPEKKTLLTRREFLKLSAVTIGAGLLKLPVPETGSFVNNRVYRTPDGLIPVSNYRVIQGDSIKKIAERFSTKISLITEANNLLNPNTIYPDQVLKIPKYPHDPMAFIPESTTIRHIIRPGDTTYSISRRYGIPEAPVVSSKLAQFRGLPAGEVLVLRAVEPTPIVPLDYRQKDDQSLSCDVVKSLVDRVANVFSYSLGGLDGLSYLVSKGVQINEGNPGFYPPNHIDITVSDTVPEAVFLEQLGHELWHQIPFPWWSAGADEGSAEFVSTEWVIGTKKFSPLFAFPASWQKEEYYDSVNTPQLRNRTFNASLNIENRTLAWEAWRRIEGRYPEIIARLTNEWAKTELGQRGSHDVTPVDTVRQLLVKSGFGNEAWTFIENQHILFTS